MNSIKAQITLVVTLATILIFSLMILSVNHMTMSSVLQIEENSMGEISEQIAHEIDTYVKFHTSNIQSFSKDSQIRASLISQRGNRYSENRLLQIIRNYDNILGLYTFDTQGIIRAGVTKSGDSIAGLNISDRDYYKAICEKGQNVFVSNIYKSKTGDGLTFSISVPVHKDDGELIGGMAVAIDWKAYAEKTVTSIKIGNEGYPYIIDSDGRMLIHPDSSILLQSFKRLDFIQDMLEHKQGKYAYVWEGRDKINTYHDIDSTGWIVSTSTYKSDLTAIIASNRNVMIGIGVFSAIVLVAILLLMLNRSIFKPLDAIMLFTEQIKDEKYNSQLNGNFTCEMEKLADNIMSMVGAIKTRLGFAQSVLQGIVSPFIVVDTEEKAQYCNEEFIKFIGKYDTPEQAEGKKLAELFYGDPSRPTLSGKAMQEGKAQVNVEREYTDNKGKVRHAVFNSSPLSDLDGKPIGAFAMVFDVTELREQQRTISAKNAKISQTASNAIQIAERVAAASGQLTSQITEVSEGADEQSKRVTETATAIEEMNATVLEVAKNAASAAQNVDSVRDKAIKSEEIVREVVSITTKLDSFANHLQDSMTDLGKQAESIGNIMSVITDIADQTNLLALNAAIEAARAGDAGRGFAVVADEVRKLAEKTMTATNEVGQAIKAIQGAAQNNISNVDDAVDYISQCAEKANTSGEALAEIVQLVSRSASQVAEIAAAAEQQSATSEQISRSVEVVNEIVNHTAQGTAQSASSVHELANMSGELNKLMVELEAS